YTLNDGFIEFEATLSKNVSIVRNDERTVLHTVSVHSIAIPIANETYGVLILGNDKPTTLEEIDQAVLGFFAELISQNVTERRLAIQPVSERSDTTTARKFNLEPGNVYLTKDDPSLAYEAFLENVRSGSEGVCITREHPGKVRKRLGLEKTPIIWLTGEASSEETTIATLQDLSITLGDFLMKAQRPIILLDGVEYLITNNTFESLLKFLQIIRDRVQAHEAVLIIPLMEKALEPRWVGLIENETEPFPSQSTGA
ncbi:MAG TPA: DUF835 domain-containing protein, partial [Candidatus Bathyarchaeia archaeon]|nr:DUF835 domain-containing protein [Candidatus Bathyarchaeia archaeon]